MKILHTGDWHIGAKLNGRSRRKEQQDVLNEIVDVATTNDVDVVFVCGDVFHDVITSSYADKLIIETLIKLADNGRRAVVVLLGNHDDSERLTASKHFAERENIFLIDSLNYDYGLIYNEEFDVNLVDCGKGYLKFKKNNETMVVNLMPYPSLWFRQEKSLPNENPLQKLKRLYNVGCAAFDKNYINVNVGHFFMPNEKQKSDIYAEITTDMIPNALYTALGHIHDRVIIEDGKNIEYCGSPYQIYATEKPNKYVIVATLNANGFVNKELIQIKSHQKICIITVNSYQDCLEKLNNKKDYLVAINTFVGNIKPDEIKLIREKFNNIISFNIIPNIKKTVDITKRNMTEKEIFSAFCLAKQDKKPTAKLMEIFEEVFKGDNDEIN